MYLKSKEVFCMKKRLFLSVVLVLILATVGFSAEKLHIWIGGQVAELDQTWNSIIGEFEENTGLEVEVQLFGFDMYYDKLLTALEGGHGPDLAFADLGGWVPTFAEQGWLVNLDEQIKEWEDYDAIWENLWPTVTYEDDYYGLPWYTDCRLLLYNENMFRDAGLDPDNPPQTWEEFLYAAMEMTDTQKRKYGYGVSGTKSEVTTLGYMMFLYPAGGQLLTDDFSASAFNTFEGLRALEFYTDLAGEYGVSPNALSYGEDDYRNMMAQNRVAMAIGGPWSFPLIETANPAIKGNYTVSVHPFATEPAAVLGGWALVIPKSSDNQKESWELAKYLTSYETWMTWIDKKGGPMPVRKDVCNDAPKLKDPKWQVIFETFPHAVNRPAIPEWPQVSSEIQTMVQDVLLGNATPEEAINRAAENVDEILAD